VKKKIIHFTNSSSNIYTHAQWAAIDTLCDKKNTFIITDQNVFKHHKTKFAKRNVIVLRAGESFKQQSTVDGIITSLLDMGCNRQSFLLGVGGGVVTDITGYAASIFMRGIKFGFVPTTLLGMVDASIGGKNGVDVGVYKNIVGTINQPEFLFYDTSFLQTLPIKQWRNGFAEIIKHAAICDAPLFKQLAENNIAFYKNNSEALDKLIAKNIAIKTNIVTKDEFEKGDRKLLNLGHTLGHAIENTYNLLHGEAISIGITAAAFMSENLGASNLLNPLSNVLEKYGLPTFANFDVEKIMQILMLDKKKAKNEVHYILLHKIGAAYIQPLAFKTIQKNLFAFVNINA
jgi:3-dehydroquinate synthase